MYQVTKNNIVTVVKGDYLEFPVILHGGKFPHWHEYILEENDIAYFGLMYPHTEFDKAIFKKVLTEKDADETGRLWITLYPEDTTNLHPGVYYYEIKVLYKDKLEVEHIDTLIQKTKFIVC